MASLTGANCSRGIERSSTYNTACIMPGNRNESVVQLTNAPYASGYGLPIPYGQWLQKFEYWTSTVCTQSFKDVVLFGFYKLAAVVDRDQGHNVTI